MAMTIRVGWSASGIRGEMKKGRGNGDNKKRSPVWLPDACRQACDVSKACVVGLEQTPYNKKREPRLRFPYKRLAATYFSTGVPKVERRAMLT